MYKKSRSGSLPRVSFQENQKRATRSPLLTTAKNDKTVSTMIRRMSERLPKSLNQIDSSM